MFMALLIGDYVHYNLYTYSRLACHKRRDKFTYITEEDSSLKHYITCLYLIISKMTARLV